MKISFWAGGFICDLIYTQQHWFTEGMFKPSFIYYKGYGIPVYKTPKEYRDYIDRLPLADTPEIFGLHPNADITLVFCRNLPKAELLIN